MLAKPLILPLIWLLISGYDGALSINLQFANHKPTPISSVPDQDNQNSTITTEFPTEYLRNLLSEITIESKNKLATTILTEIISALPGPRKNELLNELLEAFFTKETSKQKQNAMCPPGEDHIFRCGDGSYINETLVCDGRNDCEEGSDELNCSVSEVENVPVPIIVFGVNDKNRTWERIWNDVIKQDYEGPSLSTVSSQSTMHCSDSHLPSGDQFCIFQDVWLDSICNKREYWGFRQGTPCILLKLQKVLNWEPEVYSSFEELPNEMPDQLKSHIRERMMGMIGGVMPKLIWISCDGDTPADKENFELRGYHPWQGFPSYYFPYTTENMDEYLSPLVGLEFRNVQSDVLINVTCRAWAKNINENEGKIKFQLFYSTIHMMF